jgi:hypothetical protein
LTTSTTSSRHLTGTPVRPALQTQTPRSEAGSPGTASFLGAWGAQHGIATTPPGGRGGLNSRDRCPPCAAHGVRSQGLNDRSPWAALARRVTGALHGCAMCQEGYERRAGRWTGDARTGADQGRREPRAA